MSPVQITTHVFVAAVLTLFMVSTAQAETAVTEIAQLETTQTETPQVQSMQKETTKPVTTSDCCYTDEYDHHSGEDENH
jgi:hypothetical protein